MRKIRLASSDGEELIGYLPSSFAQVPLGAYTRLAVAEGLPAKIAAMAELCNLPAQPLPDDVRHYGAILKAAPWLFGGELPETLAAVASFTHLGITYAHVGPLDKINAGQLEALLAFLAENEGHPLNCAAGLLAVLYCPQGKMQTAKVVTAAQQAFATLPMSIAWPALADFMYHSGSAALSIQTYSALSEQTKVLLAILEKAANQTGGVSRISFSSMQRWLFKRWIKSVRKML